MGEGKLAAEDKLAIYELVNRAAWSYDSARMDVMGQCFTSDATMSFRIAGGDPIGPYAGRDAIVQLIRDSLNAQNDQRRHVISNIFFLTEQGAHATVSSNLTLLAIAAGQLRVLSSGLYRDVVTRAASGWQIAERFLELDLPY
jgi:SnoaL-like domain